MWATTKSLTSAPFFLVFLVLKTCCLPRKVCVIFGNPMLSQLDCYWYPSWHATSSPSEMTSWWVLGDWRTQNPNIFYSGISVSSSATQTDIYYCSVLSGWHFAGQGSGLLQKLSLQIHSIKQGSSDKTHAFSKNINNSQFCWPALHAFPTSRLAAPRKAAAISWN